MPKAVTYHEPTVMWLFMIGHSLGRAETCFGPSTQGAETETHLKSRFCLQAILGKRGGAGGKNLRLTGHNGDGVQLNEGTELPVLP